MTDLDIDDPIDEIYVCMHLQKIVNARLRVLRDFGVSVN